MNEARKLNAIFCDDIRHEINGKQSLVGCYVGVMFVSSFPAKLPRLCVYASLSTPIDFPFDGNVSLLVKKDGEVLASMNIDGQQIAQAASENPMALGNGKHHLMVTGFEFSPLDLESPCILQVLAETKDGVIFGERLRVEQMPQAQMHMPQSV